MHIPAAVYALFGVALTALVGLAQEALRGRREARTLHAAAAEAERERDHQRLEHRYEDRLKAFLTFDRAVQRHESQAIKAEMSGEISMADLGADQEAIDEIEEALLHVQLLGSKRVGDAAEATAIAVGQYSHSFAGYDKLVAAKASLRAAAQEDLGVSFNRGEASSRQLEAGT